jgi:hypothetical protein
MAVATKTQYWNSRMNGTNPASLDGSFNDNWSGSGGAASGDYWLATSSMTYSITPAASEDDLTLVAAFSFSNTSDIPAAGTVLMALDNGIKRVEVRSKGNGDKLDLVGATTVTTRTLDITMQEDEAIDLILRLTLDSSGSGKLYARELVYDDDAASVFYTVTGSSSSSATATWGNTDGTVRWASVYYSKFGAFAPEELMTSDFAQDTLSRMGIAIVNQLKDSKRMYLKTQVDDDSIVYGYDLSMNRLTKMRPPVVHVVIEGIDSPTFESLGGTKVRQNYDVRVLVTTRGTNYEDAYREGLNIIGEVFDEIYTNTGVSGTTDSIISYSAELDLKLDDDDTVCTHQMVFTYQRLIDMRHR